MSVKPSAVLFNVYSIRDVKLGVYNTPFVQTHRAGAIRAFSDLVKDQQSTISRHPEDFQLFEIGTFDQDTGRLNPHDDSLFLANATDFIGSYVN